MEDGEDKKSKKKKKKKKSGKKEDSSPQKENITPKKEKSKKEKTPKKEKLSPEKSPLQTKESKSSGSSKKKPKSSSWNFLDWNKFFCYIFFLINRHYALLLLVGVSYVLSMNFIFLWKPVPGSSAHPRLDSHAYSFHVETVEDHLVIFNRIFIST